MSAIRSGLIVSLACAACIAAAPIVFAAGVPAVSTQEPAALRNLRIVPPKSARVGTAQEEINKRIVLQWHYEFFDLGHFADASNKYMAEDFQQNDSREPSGRANYVHNFETNGYRPMAAERRPPLVAVFAQGDLVMTVIPDGWPRSDGSRADQGAIHCNMYRVRNNRIVAMWVSGGGGAPAAGPAAAPAAGPAAAPPAALAAAADASASCDRECLQGLVSNYVNALLRHEPSAVKATPHYKATLNGEPLRGTDSLWKTLEGIQSGPQYVSDVPNQEIGYLGVVTDAGQPAFLALRLKVANGLITEAESILTHDGEGGPAFEPAGLIYRESPYIRDVPKAHRSSRAELLKVANSYWDISTTTHRGETIPYTVDCWHFENGMNTDAERMLTARESPTAIESQPQDFDGRIWTCAREAILSTTAWTAARDR
ncbi:MAG TPA: hypothetical protein VMI92_04090, partial [Steroidobacteraceae bacterium]|nr:hypothetical protein [Steroidobacteraceae bacterium]